MNVFLSEYKNTNMKYNKTSIDFYWDKIFDFLKKDQGILYDIFLRTNEYSNFLDKMIYIGEGMRCEESLSPTLIYYYEQLSKLCCDSRITKILDELRERKE